MRNDIEDNNQNLDDLSMGFAFDMANNGVFDDLRELITQDKGKISVDAEEQLLRIGNYIKIKTGAIFRMEDFVEWFSGRRKLKQQGKNLPRIEDDDLIEYAKIYIAMLDDKISMASDQQKEVITGFNWLGNENQLQKLFNKLVEDEFIKIMEFDDFKFIFSDQKIQDVECQIVWLKVTLNKQTNKKSISDLINVLESSKYITYKGSIVKILSYCFKSENSELKFTHANLVKKDNYSEFRMDFEKMIEAL
ncbi:hypothetical protein [Chryseobacterium sp. G0201]|uniref:hypothetical protein n=1 Tax=Chryseobacterium sp. G0201 TaxID=2487065 RepID=UPI000F4E92B7|nr:hypothetical protein [Chryseobacterium sp. G0201]AZA51557.1 hypothetical protein EG348_00325 [Chryseobacterium sp. G0201]